MTKWKSKISEPRMGAILVGVVCAAYMMGWWNLYLSPMCGGDLFSMIAPPHGWLPYRDYYYQSPPGNILLLGWLGKLFGAKLIVPWAFHSILNVIGAVGFYYVLLRFTSPFAAALSVVLAFVLGFGDLGDTPSWYFHQIANCAVFGLHFLLKSLESSHQPKSGFWNIVTGIFLGWAFAVKQTMAPVVLAFFLVPIVIGLRRSSLRRWAAISIGSYCVGLLAVLTPVIIWLTSNGILGACLDQAFLKGTRSKGPLSSALVRPIVGLWDYGPHRDPTIYAILILALIAVVAWIAKRPKSNSLHLPHLGMLLLGFFFLAAMQIGWYSSWNHLDLRTPALTVSGISSLGAFSLAAWASWELLEDDSMNALLRWTLLFVLGAQTYGATLGWAMGEVVAFPAIGAITAIFWAATSHWRRSQVVHGAIAAMVLCGVTYGAWRKEEFPNNLFWWSEPPIGQSNTAPRVPELSGFFLSEPSAKLFEEINMFIHQYVKPGDEILAYPNMQVFYALADAKAPTLCLNHWFDICPDEVVLADVKKLKEHPPKMIIAEELPIYGYAMHESFFREGKPSGQRHLWVAILELTKNYKVLAEYKQTEATMKVWLRNDGT